MSLAVNLAGHDIQAGRAGTAAVAVQELLDSGISGADAVWAASMLAWAHLQRAEFAEAQSAIDVGRRLAQRWPGAIWTIDLAWIEAELRLWSGAPERAIALAQESRDASPAGDTVAAVRADSLMLRALAEITREGRRGPGDDVAVTAAVRQAEAVALSARDTIREHPFPGPQLHYGEALQAGIEAELARARGASDASLWAECARLERHAGWRAAAAYSELQRARALQAAEADLEEIREAIVAGLADPIASEPARRELVGMAGRLDIDVTTARLPARAVGDPSGD